MPVADHSRRSIESLLANCISRTRQLSLITHADATLREAAAVLRTRPDDVVERLKALVEEKKALEK